MTESRISEAAVGEREPLKFIGQKRFGWLGVLMMVSAGSFLVAAYGVITEKNNSLYSVCMVIGSLCMSIITAEQIWHTRVVKYNEKVVRIVINRFKTHYGFRFKDVKGVELNDDELFVFNRSNGLQRIDLREIEKEDQARLVKFLEERTIKNN